jgi:hypothetical protein
MYHMIKIRIYTICKRKTHKLNHKVSQIVEDKIHSLDLFKFLN